MTTPDLITLIIEYIGSELTRPRALTYLNNAQNQLLVVNNRLMRVLPDPFLTTTAGVYGYVASTSLFSSVGNEKGSDQFDIYNVSRIYSLTKDNTLFFRYNGAGNASSSRMYRPLNARASDEVFSVADVVKSIEPNSQDCMINWWGENDPGATTVDWRVECYRYPNQLTAEGIAMETPAKYQSNLLLWMVLEQLDIRQYGTSNKTQLIAPALRKFNAETMAGDRSRSRFTTPREV